LALVLAAAASMVGVVVVGIVAARPPEHERPDVAHALATAVAQQDVGETVLLASVAPFRWSDAYVFAPYTDVSQLSDALGFRWSPCSPLWAILGCELRLSTEDQYLLVFVDASAQSVTGWTETVSASPVLVFKTEAK
jgi:hypothetical protein